MQSIISPSGLYIRYIFLSYTHRYQSEFLVLNKITLLLYLGVMQTLQPTKVNDSSKIKAENTI